MIFKNKSFINLIYIITLFVINIASHYIPFERLIISPDTFSFIGANKNGLMNFIINPDRPLEYLIHEYEYYIFGYN